MPFPSDGHLCEGSERPLALAPQLLPPVEALVLKVRPEEEAALVIWLAEEAMVMTPLEELEVMELVTVLTPVELPPRLMLLSAKLPAELQKCWPTC